MNTSAACRRSVSRSLIILTFYDHWSVSLFFFTNPHKTTQNSCGKRSCFVFNTKELKRASLSETKWLRVLFILFGLAQKHRTLTAVCSSSVWLVSIFDLCTHTIRTPHQVTSVLRWLVRRRCLSVWEAAALQREPVGTSPRTHIKKKSHLLSRGSLSTALSWKFSNRHLFIDNFVIFNLTSFKNYHASWKGGS